jgi:hypothetical protein
MNPPRFFVVSAASVLLTPMWRVLVYGFLRGRSQYGDLHFAQRNGFSLVRDSHSAPHLVHTQTSIRTVFVLRGITLRNVHRIV